METLPQHCDNCGTALQGAFCHHCGQEKKSYIRNLTGVLSEFFGEFSNWDSRLWRTLWPLWFRPGLLTRRYVQGHRVPYVPPLRLYIFTSVLAFLIMAQLFSFHTLNALEEEVASQPVQLSISEQSASDSAYFHVDMSIPFLSDRAQQRFNRQVNLFQDEPGRLVSKLFSLAPQMMVLLLPLFALLLKLLYIRSNRFYMEHLILALHSHSFILQMGVFVLLLDMLQSSIPWLWLANPVEWLKTALFWWIPLYLLLCQKFYYQQGWGKTLLKFWFTSSIYSLVFLFASVALMILSVLWM
ncbi:DUF3667 domain-containing protein [Alkalimonas delamerensis]|uniref:DUF3667 domain-containing protein n=1 Tax=Alkalimonas delamerensis TaxID=265981 RepID=A0ABT9GQ41_9GAMM|nr:DUF3667 domain-containing protein [Alkalimonas delamerensis]MDP4529066.1 DUF3667 domain-containing protein [Alkalimonas delamerensis]